MALRYILLHASAYRFAEPPVLVGVKVYAIDHARRCNATGVEKIAAERRRGFAIRVREAHALRRDTFTPGQRASNGSRLRVSGTMPQDSESAYTKICFIVCFPYEEKQPRYRARRPVSRP